VQRVTVQHRPASKLAALNARLFGIRLGNFRSVVTFRLPRVLRKNPPRSAAESGEASRFQAVLRNRLLFPHVIVELFRIRLWECPPLNRRFVDAPLVLGQLRRQPLHRHPQGRPGHEPGLRLPRRPSGLGERGFVNYFGLQRFGSGTVTTHAIGRALLRGEWGLWWTCCSCPGRATPATRRRPGSCGPRPRTQTSPASTCPARWWRRGPSCRG